MEIIAGFILALTSLLGFNNLQDTEHLASVELGLAEVSPLGEEGGYAVPASGCSYITQLDSHGEICVSDIPLSLELDAFPNPTTYNGSTMLDWTVYGATGCDASDGWSGGKDAGDGSWYQIVNNLTATTTFTLTCYDDVGNSVVDTVTVGVIEPDLSGGVSVSITADPLEVMRGLGTAVLWEVRNATDCTASGGWSGSKNSNTGNHAQFVDNLQSDTTFTITCIDGSGGSATDSVTVTVINNLNSPSVELFADPLVVEYDGSTQLTWFVANSNSCSASNGWSGSKSSSDGQHNQTVNNIIATTTFEITCTDGSDSDYDEVTVFLTYPEPTITATPQVVKPGEDVTIEWDPQAYTDCTLSSNLENDPDFIADGKSANIADTFVVNPTGQTTYSIYCATSGSGAEVDVHVVPVIEET